MTEHEEHADRLDRQVDDMQEQSEDLGRRVDDARKDWESKQRDPAVPGATGDPEHAEGGPEPEQQYPSKGD
jgi:hypothetical protein